MKNIFRRYAPGLIALVLLTGVSNSINAAEAEHKHEAGQARQAHSSDEDHAAHSEAAPHAHGHTDHDDHADHGAHHDHDAEPEPAKGPNNGRLLQDGDITLELAIFEDGVPPEYRAWITQAGKAIAPASATLSVELTRLGNQKTTIPFKAEGDFSRGTVEVTEPHSFQVSVSLTLDGKTHSWQFDSFEGRTRIRADMAEASGVRVASVGPANIGEARTLFGQVTLDPDRSASVRGRFAGLVQSVHVKNGDVVAQGQLLASVQSNDSLRSYSVTAPIGGTVLARMTNVGDVVGAEPLFELGDTQNVLLEIRAFGRDAALLQAGTEIVVLDSATQLQQRASIARVLPQLDPATRATIAIAKITSTPAMPWRPGLAVSVQLGLEPIKAAIAVDVRAIQRFRDWEVVFIKIGDDYEIRPLTIGTRDSRFAEVLSGIALGDQYVVEQSFLIKADIEKSGAAHDH